jgi:hypothetical protein
MRRLAPCLLLVSLAWPASAQSPLPGTVAEEIGSWRLGCVTDRMTDRLSCQLRHKDWVERSGSAPGLALEIVERQGKLVPAVTARDLSLEGASRGLLALTGTAQLRFDQHPMLELPCGLEGRSLVCAPRAADAERAASELKGARRVLARMAGPTGSQREPTELALADTAAALERYRRLVPPGSPPHAAGLDLPQIIERLQRLFAP